MGNSLFDQLKKSGLIDEKKAKQAKKEKHRQVKQLKGKKTKPLAESKLHVKQADAEKVARDRKLNQQRKQAAEKNAIAAQIKQLIQMNRIKKTDGQIGFNFIDGNKIQLLYVTGSRINWLRTYWLSSSLKAVMNLSFKVRENQTSRYLVPASNLIS